MELKNYLKEIFDYDKCWNHIKNTKVLKDFNKEKKHLNINDCKVSFCCNLIYLAFDDNTMLKINAENNIITILEQI